MVFYETGGTKLEINALKGNTAGGGKRYAGR